MTDAPWDEGQVAMLRADRDRAVAAVRTLRAALGSMRHGPEWDYCWCLVSKEYREDHSSACKRATAVLAATAEWEETP